MMLLRVEATKGSSCRGFKQLMGVRSCIVALAPEDFKEAINIF
jgi:hypothetical protein